MLEGEIFMELTEAIAALNNSEIEGKEGILESINNRLQETDGLSNQVNSLRSNLDNILGITGANEGSLTQKLEKAQETIKGLQSVETNYREQLSERDQTIAQMRQESVISEASRLTNANATVLKTLLSQGDISLLVKEGKAYISSDNKEIELRDYAKDKWGDFVPSLFPSIESPETPSVTLPGGNSSGQQPLQTDVVNSFLDKKYSRVNEMFKQAV